MHRIGRRIVFISYNAHDRKTAEEIAEGMLKTGAKVWFAEWNLPAGTSLTEAVSSGLKKCTHVLLLWSQHAARSRWVKREASAATLRLIAEKRVTVIPVRLDDTPLPALLTDLKYVDYRNPGALLELKAAVVGNRTVAYENANFIDAMLEIAYDLPAEQLGTRPGVPTSKPVNRYEELGSWGPDRSADPVALGTHMYDLLGGDSSHPHHIEEVAWDESRFGKQVLYTTKFWVLYSRLYSCPCGLAIVVDFVSMRSGAPR